MGTSEANRSAVSLPWPSLRVPRSSLGQLDAFDEGGEGTLYRVRDLVGSSGMPLLYKEYKASRRAVLDTQTLERFPVFARSLNQNALTWLYDRASWPVWIVDDNQGNGQPDDLGVLMPLAQERFMADLRRPTGGSRRVPAKFELLLNGKRFLENVGIGISMRQRLKLLAEVADTMAFLHAHSIVVGDFSCTNLLFSLQPRPSCFFLDCDSMSWSGHSALPPGETPEWELPAGETLSTASGDVYKFALLVLRMHTGAQHHRDATRLPADTWPALRKLVEHTLSSPPHDRPLITDWTGPLQAAAASAPAGVAPMPASTALSPARQAGSAPGAAARAAAGHPAAGPPRSSFPVAYPAAGQGSIRPTDRMMFWVMRMLRRLLWRRSAPPSVSKMIVMLVGLWTACAAAFGVAWLAGTNLSHMTPSTELPLFASFVIFALVAFGLGVTEPR